MKSFLVAKIKTKMIQQILLCSRVIQGPINLSGKSHIKVCFYIFFRIIHFYNNYYQLNNN
jgi:hypothetical protein